MWEKLMVHVIVGLSDKTLVQNIKYNTKQRFTQNINTLNYMCTKKYKNVLQTIFLDN